MKEKVYGHVAKKCPSCGARMSSKTYVAPTGMLKEKHTCPACGKQVDRPASTMSFPDRDAI